MTDATTLEAKIYAGKAVKVSRVAGNRHYVKPGAKAAEEAQSMCNACGGAHVRRGYCTGCGYPA